MRRIKYTEVAHGGYKAMAGLEQYARRSGLGPSLLELIKTRASQTNGCAFCLDMHTKDARAAVETEQRLYTPSAWEETPFFTDRRRAALAWTEGVTRVADTDVPDRVFEDLADPLKSFFGCKTDRHESWKQKIIATFDEVTSAKVRRKKAGLV